MVVFANLPSRESDEEAIMPDSGSSDQEAVNGKQKRKTDSDGEMSKKRRKSKDKSAKTNGTKSKRRHSVSKPARDPRDEAIATDSSGKESDSVVRSPSPLIDFDGLSKPSKCFVW